MKHTIYLIAIITLFTKCKQKESETATEATTENVTTTAIADSTTATVQEQTPIAEEPKKETSKLDLPFVGKRKFNFLGGSGTDEIIIIRKDGYTILKSVGSYGEIINYEGPYKKIMDMPAGDESTFYYKISGNTISMVDANGKIENNCKGDNKPCTELLEEF
jgi:hypothetical protein